MLPFFIIHDLPTHLTYILMVYLLFLDFDFASSPPPPKKGGEVANAALASK